MHADERGAGEDEAKPLVQKMVEGPEAQRSKSKLLETVGSECSLHAEGRRRGLRGAPGEYDADRPVVQATEREAEHARRRRIEPLDVVHSKHQRSSGCEQANSARKRERDGALVRGDRGRLLEEKRDLERVPLRAGKSGKHLSQARVEQVGERSE